MAHPAMGMLYLILSAVALVGSLLVLRLLLRPRRRGNTPHCARCDYNLTGLTSDRCPECGAEMAPASIVYGELVGRPLVKVLAVVVVVSLLIPAVRWGWNYDWYRVRPTSWVISDVQSANAAVKFRAWRELDRRVRAGALTAGQESRLIDVCLLEQAANNPMSQMIDYLGASLVYGKMSQSQKTLLFRQILQLELVVRQTVIAGSSVPIEVRHESRAPSWPPLFSRIEQGGVDRLDGKAANRRHGTTSYSTYGCGARGGAGSTIPLSELGKEISLGRHSLGLTVRLRVFNGDPYGRDNRLLMHQAEIPLEASFELLATEPPDYVRLINDPSYKPLLLTAVQPERVQRDHTGMLVHVHLKLQSLPVNVAFDAVARANDREYSCGTVTKAKGESTNRYLEVQVPKGVTTLDLILRSSQEAAKNTVDLFEIWDGELVYPNLRVKPADGFATQSGPGS